MPVPTLLEHPSVLRYLFHPRRETAFDGLGKAQVVRLPVGPQLALGGRLFVSHAEAPTLLFWHGNGEIAADYDDLAPLYTGMGIHFLAMDYRGYGISDGQPTGTALLADAVAIYPQVRSLLAAQGIRSSRLYVMGRSLGSAAAIETARHAQGEIAGLIIESGFAFTIPLLERLGALSLSGVGEEQGFGNHAKMAHLPMPVLVIHGEWDEIIPLEEGHALYEQVAHRHKRWLPIAESGHNDLMMVGQRAYFEAIRNFILAGDAGDSPPGGTGD
ncbi:MAG: alpha/beta hydrolase [Magnetococcales bacterium]|nr:alpha/beta hydrolase [Magnetococcales bacterium]